MSFLAFGGGPRLSSVQGASMSGFIDPGDEGFAVDFTRGVLAIQDYDTPGNTFTGLLGQKLGTVGAPGFGGDGAAIDASNFHRLAYTSWPYDRTQIVIAGEIKFDTTTDATQRSVFQIDSGGDDRLYVVSLATSDDLTFSIGSGAGASNIAAANVITADTWFTFVAVAGPVGAFLVINDTVAATSSTILNANSAPVAQSGIGANAATTTGATNTQPLKGRMRSLVVLNRPISQEVAKAGWPFGLSLVAIGDSLTHGVIADVTQDEAYPALLGERIARIVNATNAGDSGDTTGEMYARRSTLIADGTPDIVIIYGGTNDVANVFEVQASPSPTSTVFTVETGEGTHFGNDSWITVGGEQAQISTVVGDVITLVSPLAGGAPAAGTLVANDTEKNLAELALYAASKGCEKVIIAGNHYWNWTSGGDTVATPLARNATLRTYQSAAATTAGAVYVDLHAWMRQLIIDGEYTQGDNGWHSSSNNQHLNEAGQQILADAFEDAIRSQGWA